MKIGIFSDVHLHRPEHKDDIEALLNHINSFSNLDLLIFAGDISHKSSQIFDFLNSIKLKCKKAWVPGNHDIWVIDPESNQDSANYRYTELFPKSSKQIGWHYLPREPLVISRYMAVIGSIGWFSSTNNKGYSEWFDIEVSINDQKLAKSYAHDIEKQINMCAGIKSLIIVTHHLCNKKCIPEGDSCVTEYNDFITPIVSTNKARIVLIVHGHEHYRYGPVLIDNIRYVAHPFGYPSQHSCVSDGFKVLDI